MLSFIENRNIKEKNVYLSPIFDEENEMNNGVNPKFKSSL